MLEHMDGYDNFPIVYIEFCSVKDAGQTLFYSGIVIAWGGGLFATGAFLFALVSELFSSQSPNSLYSDALKKCKEFPRICHLLGKPIVGFRGSHDDTRRILRFP